MRAKVFMADPAGTPMRLLIRCPGCGFDHQLIVAGDRAWEWNGRLDLPTFSPSLFSNPPGEYHNPAVPICHSHIRDGRIQFLGDCTHALAGQTVDLPEIE